MLEEHTFATIGMAICKRSDNRQSKGEMDPKGVLHAE